LLYADLPGGLLLEVRPRVEGTELLEVSTRRLNAALDERPRGDGNENRERASPVAERTECTGQAQHGDAETRRPKNVVHNPAAGAG